MSKAARAIAAVPSVAKPWQPAKQTSPARHDLAEAMLDLRDAERKAEAARMPLARLETKIADAAAARGPLTELDARYAIRMAEWAAGGADAAPVPEPDLAGRQDAEATLNAASLTAEAARRALTQLRQTIAEADAQLGDARARIKPAAARVLREEGSWLAAEYWRRYADLEQVRRELTALDQVLIDDFPIIHEPTGRMVVHWLSPVKLAADAALAAAETACAGLDGVTEFARYWRAKAEDLMR